MQSALRTSLSLSSPNALQSTLTGQAALAIAATGLVALCAHLSLPLPFTVIPLTLQTFAVILVGMVLGPVAGFTSLALYLAEGAFGLPVFSPHSIGLHGPTAGFLVSYPFAAAAAGLFTRNIRLSSSSFRNGLIGGSIASLPIFAFGAFWLAQYLHLAPQAAWSLAVAPFIPGEILKVTAAAAIFSGLQRWRKSLN